MSQDEKARREQLTQEVAIFLPGSDVVVAGMAQAPQPRIAADPELIEAALDSITSPDGRLVPPPLADVELLHEGDAGEQRKAELLELMNQLVRDHAQAKATGQSYGSHLKAWRAWCAANKTPALPFAPDLVAEHLMHYAFQRDEAGFVQDDDGRIIGAVRAVTLSQRLAALNKAAEFLGLPKPGENPGVRLLMRSFRRYLGVATVNQKRAIDAAMLERCLAASSGLTYVNARGRAAVLMRARTGATAGQMQKLRWRHITHAYEETCISLEPAHRNGKATEVTVAKHPNPDLDLATALEELRSLAQSSRPHDPVFPNGKWDKPMTRQALHLIVTTAVCNRCFWEEVPALSDAVLATLLAARHPVEPLPQSRDRALALIGFHTALRRSNLVAIRWGHLEEHGDAGMSVKVYKTKTDQEGTEKTKWIAQAPPGSRVTCPATAVRAWRQALVQALGREPMPDEPVFPAMTSAGTLKHRASGKLRPMSGHDVNAVIQRLATAARLPGAPTGQPGSDTRHPYGAHSTRVGFVTEALRDDKLTIGEVQEVTDHETVDILMRYKREVNAPERNASRKLLGVLSQ